MNVSQIFSSLKNISHNKKVRYGFFIFACYLFFLIYSLPASVVLRFIHLPKNITLSSVSGTIWSGKVRQVKYSSPGFEIGTLAWELHPLNLILGEISADITVSNGEQFISSGVSVAMSGALKLEDTRFSINIATLQPLTYGMPFSYAGEVSGNFPVSYIHKNQQFSLTGQLDLNDVRLISPQQQSFGDINIEFRAEKEGGSSAIIKDLGGPLRLTGQLLLNKNAGVSISTQLSAREADSSLEQMISILGKKDETGRVHFNQHFQL